ncbi:glycosyltransferase [Streptomyces clavifer]|uniref:glycosyltransferase n=1 Tax=Streptomyces clavifer TaxID=68188 RepID=UPI0038B57303
MRALLSAYGSRGDVEPLVALAVRLRALGAEVRVCAPPDEESAQRPAGVGVPLVVVPQPADQPYGAGRVAGPGIGTAHDGPVPATASLPAALGAAPTPGVRARATAVAGAIRTDGAAVAEKPLFNAVG